MDTPTKTATLNTLDRFEQIINNEMLIHNMYFDDDDPDQVLRDSGAPCGGNRMCAVGSLVVAGGVENDYKSVTDICHYRHHFSGYPGLEEAYEALNSAARRVIVGAGFDADEFIAQIRRHITVTGELESLFEGYWLLTSEPYNDFAGDTPLASNEERETLLNVIADARLAIVTA